jgi:hypothetical protein
MGLLGIAACTPAAVTGQANPDSVRHRNYCRLAEQVLSSGHPAPHEGWALGVIWNCPEAGPTLAAALTAATVSTDTVYLNALTAPFIQIRDGHVFAAGLAVAGNRGASLPARAAGIRTVMYAVQPGGYVDPDALPNPRSINCFGTPSPHSQVLTGAPLPSDYLEQARALMSRITADQSEAEGIRRAARCAMYLIRLKLGTGG